MSRRIAICGSLALIFAYPALGETGAPPTAPTAVSAAAEEIMIPPPPAGLGLIVFFRNGRLTSANYGCTISEDAKMLSHLDSARYFLAGAGPGVHSFTAGGETARVLRLTIEPGKTYYVQCSIGLGEFEGRLSLSPSTDDKFRRFKLTRMAPP